MMREAFGTDFGGVLADSPDGREHVSFQNFNLVTIVPGAFDAVRDLVEKKFKNQMFIISKCNEPTEMQIRKWLDHAAFFERTGMHRDNLRFVRDWSHKAIVARELGLTHFVVDRPRVFYGMESVPNKFLFRPNPEDVLEYAGDMKALKTVDSWDEVVREVLSS